MNFYVANKNLHVLTLDIQDLEGFSKFAKQVDDIVGKEGLNLLINNAGVLHREKERVSAVTSMVNPGCNFFCIGSPCGRHGGLLQDQLCGALVLGQGPAGQHQNCGQ